MNPPGEAPPPLLQFPGLLPPNDLDVQPGGCEMAAGRCVWPVQIEVVVDAINLRRFLCRECAGWFLIGLLGTEKTRGVHVDVYPATAAPSARLAG